MEKSVKVFAFLFLAGLVAFVFIFILASSSENSEEPFPIEDPAQQNNNSNKVTVHPPKSCQQLRLTGETRSGVYPIQPGNSLPAFEVFCDMTTNGGGWTVIQRRGTRNIPKYKRESFYRSWSEYEIGFGRKTEDYWLGLEKIHSLTKDCKQELRINLKDWDEVSVSAIYGNFSISGKEDFYKLQISGYSGNAGDNMAHQNGMQFTTYDRDNDEDDDENCAVKYHGAWWYRACYWSNLNGEYSDDGRNGVMPNRKGIGADDTDTATCRWK